MFQRHFFYVLSGLLCATLVIASGHSNAETKAHSGIVHSGSFIGVPGAKTVGSETCSSCHADQAKDFRHAFHAREGVECEDCHGAGSLHVDGGGDTSKIVSFSKGTARDANAACLNCHAQAEHVRNWSTGAHARNGVHCMDCHQVHPKARNADAALQVDFISMHPDTRPADDLLAEDRRSTESLELSNQNCLRCHQTQRGQLNLPSHHPLREGKVGCIDCHDAHGGPTGNNLRTSTPNELCLTCHAKYRGPFAYQHPPVTENCMTCHSPHGSTNSNLLNVSEPALCLQCHASHETEPINPGQPTNTFLAADRCTNCHGSIHGTEVGGSNGGALFEDQGPLGVPTQPAQGAAAAAANLNQHPTKFKATPLPGIAAGLSGAGTVAGFFGGASHRQLSGGAVPLGTDTTTSATQESATSVATSYRFLDSTGFPGRVGEYDSLEESEGAEAQNAFVSYKHDIAIKSRASIISSDDYNIKSELVVAHRYNLHAGLDTRSLVQQQDTYRTGLPTLIVTDVIPEGSVYSIKRRLSNAYAHVDLPTRIPVKLFVKGNWQAQVGTEQLSYLDQFDTPASNCLTACHWTSQFQHVNQTTRGVSGGAQVTLGKAAITYEHGYSSFNNRLQFPFGTFAGLPVRQTGGFDTLPGNYYIRVLPPTESSSDKARLNWLLSPNLTLNGDITYSRLLDRYLDHKANTLVANTTATWRPAPRVGLTADYHAESFINDFLPYYSKFGNVSHHSQWEGVKGNFDLASHLNAELYYKHSGITRSNADEWPSVYPTESLGSIGIDFNFDALRVVSESTANTGGLALRYQNSVFSARTGYEYTNTHNPGYLTTPGSDSRAFIHNTLTPTHLLTLTNDFSVRVKNAYPSEYWITGTGSTYPAQDWSPADIPSVLDHPGPHNSHFYDETFSASVPVGQHGDVSIGYSYQQNKLNTPMFIAADNPGPASSVYDFVVREPSVPYNQLSQTYWGQISKSAFFQKRLGIDARVNYNSARSRMNPDVNPNDFLLLGNGPLIQAGGYCTWTGFTGSLNCFDPTMFQGALEQLHQESTKISEVKVPEWVGQGKVYYRLPRGFNTGLLFNTGTYRDYWNPDRNGDLRAFTVYLGRIW